MTVVIADSQKIGTRLPDDWRWMRLGEVCEIIMGQSPEGSSYNVVGKGIPLLNGPTEFGAINPIPKQWTTEPTKFAVAGDILLCVRGATTGRKNMADQQYCIGRGLAAIRGNSQQALTGFLWFLLDFITAALLGEASGSTFPNLPGEKLKSIKVPVPPLAEQQHIVAILNEQMVTLQKAKAAAEAQLEAAKALPSAYLRTVFEGDETQKWVKKPIGAIAKLQSGYAFKSEWFVPNGIRLLRNINILQGFISWENQVCLPLDRRGEFQSFELSEGDIVLSLDRPVVSGGLKIARLDSLDVPSLLLQRVGRFQLRDSIDPGYLYAFLNSTAFISAITVHDQSLGVPHVSPSQVEAVPLPLPSLEEQQAIANKLNVQMRAIGQARTALEEQLNMVKSLPEKLLHRAFNGEI